MCDRLKEPTEPIDDDLQMFFEEIGLNHLKSQEEAPVDWSEVVLLAKSPTEEERLRLLESGLSESEITNGKLTRQQLWDAGFAFINHLGGGEKPLIAGIFPVGDREIDTAHRTLLTHDELAVVKSHQLAAGITREYSDLERDKVRSSMLAFMILAEQAVNQTAERKKELFRESFAAITEGELSDEMITNINRLIEENRENPVKGHFIVEDCAAGLDLAQVLGTPVDMFWNRRSALQGQISPFIDSAFRFGDNPDVTLFPNQPDKTKRLNMAVVHLLSRGISEVGKSINDSHDQTYLTPTEFETLVDNNKESADDNSDEISTLFRERLAYRLNDPQLF